MADIEKVIKGLDCRGNDIRVPYEKFPCDCPYFVKKDEKHSYSYCDLHKVLNDAIELLKKQEPMNVIETSKDRIGVPEKSCPKCNIPLYKYVYGQGYLGEIRYCPWCGQAVKWE